MTHLPYIVASYAVTLAGVLWLGVGARWRLRRATRRLASLDQAPRR